MNRNLQAAQFFHGTDRHISNGQIEAGHGGQWDTVAPGGEQTYSSHKYSYATTDPEIARDHAAGSSPTESALYGGRLPRVYQVEPTGHVLRDPEDKGEGLFMSEHPWRIVREVSRLHAADVPYDQWPEHSYGGKTRPVEWRDS